jgi:predicted dehydrogenase
LKVECQHFLDCINHQEVPLSGGREGVELVRILEACTASLKQNGAVVEIGERSRVVNGIHKATAAIVSKQLNGRTSAAL